MLVAASPRKTHQNRSVGIPLHSERDDCQDRRYDNEHRQRKHRVKKALKHSAPPHQRSASQLDHGRLADGIHIPVGGERPVDVRHEREDDMAVVAEVHQLGDKFRRIVRVGKHYFVYVVIGADSTRDGKHVRFTKLLDDAVPEARVGGHGPRDALGDLVAADQQHAVCTDAGASHCPPVHQPEQQAADDDPDGCRQPVADNQEARVKQRLL